MGQRARRDFQGLHHGLPALGRRRRARRFFRFEKQVIGCRPVNGWKQQTGVTMYRHRMRWLLVVIGIAAAVTAEAASKKAKVIETALNAGLTLTDGNSETLQAHAGLITEGDQISGLRARRSGSPVRGEHGQGRKGHDGRHRKNLRECKKDFVAPDFTPYLDGAGLYDNVAQVDYRATLGPGLGAYLLKDARTVLSVETGPSYVWEKVADVTDDYLALRVAGRLEWQVSETAKFWQAAEYLAAVEDFDNVLVTVEIGLEAAVDFRVDLRLVLQDK